MAFRTFDRSLYFALESSEGAWTSPTLDTGYLETIDPTFTVTPRVYERNPTRLSMTPAPNFHTGTSVLSPGSAAEISFTVEMAGSGTLGTAPRWAALLKACGMTELSTVKSAAIGDVTRALGGPAAFRNYENVSTTGSAYDATQRNGRVISDTFKDDGTLYYQPMTGTPNPIGSTEAIWGQASAATATASGGEAASGLAYVMDSGTEQGGGDNSSISIRVYLNQIDQVTVANNAHIDFFGCRGNVEFVMAAGDRVLMNFTFMGKVYQYRENTLPVPTAEGRPIPPAFVGVDMAVQDSNYGVTSTDAFTGQVFSTFNLNLGNEVILREDADSGNSGYLTGWITGRTPTATWNPDAVLADSGVAPSTSTINFWDRFITGETIRSKFTVGSTAGNQFVFKMPAMQFTGLADGNRDEVVVYDSTTTLTGGDYGSSVQDRGVASSGGVDDISSTVTNARLGTNNELVLFIL